MTIDQIINKVKDNDPQADTDILRRAFKFADQAHGNQKRETGEPYIQHSLHTAFVLAQIKCDLETVTAGILHDIPEDTNMSLEDIQEKFGDEVSGLVAGVTKISKIKYRGEERYIESLRKMFISMSHDLRVVLIKFCDRLHNLRTLDAMPEHKRLRVARETLEFYAPIAGLLGIWRLKWQMEDICFKHLYPEEFKKIEYEYEVEKKVERNKYIQRIKNSLGQKLNSEGIKFTIEGRFKHLYSIYQKMQKKDREFNEIHDVFALRVIVDSIPDCYKTLGIIHSLWRPQASRIKDYIAVPKPNGYRSLHTTVYGPDNIPTEFQIRTHEMHEEALYGIAAHWHYKKDRDCSKNPVWIDEILNIQRQSQDTNDFIKKIKFDIFHDRIFVFSPKGDVFDLPENSTPIDFAYAVHSEIGNKATHALVNEKMASLDKPLNNGDKVEIIIDKKRKVPNRDWLKFVKTSRAQEKIRQATAGSKLGQIAGAVKLPKIFPGGKK